MIVRLCMMIRGAEDLQLTDEIVEKIENALRNDRRLTVDELSAIFPQISRFLLHETVSKMGPKTADRQHKLNQVEAGQEFLRCYKLHGDEFLEGYYLFTSLNYTWLEKGFQPTRR